MAEQRTVTASVAGSSPAVSAIGVKCCGRTRVLGTWRASSILADADHFVHVPQGGCMENVMPAHFYPELSTEQKLSVREAQFNLDRVRQTALATVQNAEKAVMSVLEKIAADLKIDVSTAQFGLDTLVFTDKP
jgi:hypothetical protein